MPSWKKIIVSGSNLSQLNNDSGFILSSQTSSFVTNLQTSSFVLNSQTSSFVKNSQTSSFVTNSQTSSFILNSQTSSFVQNNQTSSFVTNNQTSSFVINSQTSSFVQNSQTSSFVLNSQTGSFVKNSQTSSMSVATASYISGAAFTSNNPALSASYALTASYAMNGGGGGTPGGSNTQIQFNSSNTFAGASSFTFNSNTNQVQITGSLIVSSSAGSGSLNTLTSILADYNNNTSVDWKNRRLYDSATYNSIEWNGRTLFDNAGNNSVLWNTRQLSDTNGNTALSWGDTSTSNGVILYGTASYALNSGGGSIGPGLENTLALWDTTTTIASSSITHLRNSSATDNAVVSQSLYKVNADGVKIGSVSYQADLSSSLHSNLNVNNISPASNFITISANTYKVIKRLDLAKYNIVDHSGCYGMILDFSLMLSDTFNKNQTDYKYDKNSWPQTNFPYYVETGRIYLSWLGADYDNGGVFSKGNQITYITMAQTINHAQTAGWDAVDTAMPSVTALGASEEGVVAPYNAPAYRDANGGYQFGYKLVNNNSGEWYVEVALYNDTSTDLRITHTTNILTLFTNP